MTRTRPRRYERPPAWPALMTADIVCAYLGDISRQLLYRWARNEQFPVPVRIAGVQRWSRAALDAWIERRDAAAPGADGHAIDSSPSARRQASDPRNRR